jgi:Pyruvate/2-oxoacid:ferredoxin oxidoreductase delta subunit
MKPVINEEKCPAIGQYCPAIPACSENAMSYVVDKSIRKGGRIVFNYEKCNECGICVTKCCGSAIELN